VVLFWIFAGLTVLGLIAYGLQILSLRSYASGPDCRGKDDSSQYWPPVSILKPLKGLDDNLLDNLESFCLQDYPQYEIIFSLQDHNDPSYRVARKVQEKYPEKGISILVERCTAGLNPKVNNLIPAYKAARYPTILISDSNVMVERDCHNLTIITSPTTPSATSCREHE
jgi:ceramide glucosyltransferase